VTLKRTPTTPDHYAAVALGRPLDVHWNLYHPALDLVRGFHLIAVEDSWLQYVTRSAQGSIEGTRVKVAST
jgi:hypothetical protein